MTDNVQKILNDLYAIEPSLKAKEAALLPLVEKMVSNRPNIVINEHFVQELRSKLVEQALLLPRRSPYSQFLRREFLFGAVGALAVILIVAPLLSRQPPSSITFGSRIDDVGEKAFGDITFSAPSGAESFSAGMGGAPQIDQEVMKLKDLKMAENGTAGSGVAKSMPMTAAASAVEAPVVTTTDPARSMRIYPAPEFDYRIAFAYEGDPTFKVAETLPVYKRNVSTKPSGELASIASKLNVDLLDLKKFSNLKVGSFSLREDRPFGYLIDFNFMENHLYISKNWEKWPQPDFKCMALGCESSVPKLDPSQIPSDEELIRMADEFLKTYGIDTSHYGERFVNNYWKRFPTPIAETKGAQGAATEMYVPEEVPVIFQLVIDGKPVFDEGGQPTGLYVSIDIRNKRVAGVNTIVPHTYAKSSYPAINSVEKVIADAEKGGRFGYVGGFPESKNIKTIKLGTPKLVLMRAWLPQTEPGQSGEIYVPAYNFPVIERPEGIEYYVGESVMVPAISGLFPDAPEVSPLDATLR